jgi:N-acetylmuramoyl-L-alanine amidase
MITRIVVHCSDSPQGRGDDAAAIHRWHLERGFDGIGYHWVITEDGTRQAGRPEYWTGSHVKKHNTGSIGICLIGRDSFTDSQHSELVALIRELLKRYPGADIVGHYQLDSGKTCPNIDIPAWRIEHGL